MDKILKSVVITTAIAGAMICGSMQAIASTTGQFIPLMVYRTGSFAPLGIPWADGKLDYLKLINERDGGVNGVKLIYQECETAYVTTKGVKCYEQMKNAHGGASGFDTQSTGITFAVTDNVYTDKQIVITTGYGLSQSADGRVFKWNFPLLGHYWTAYDVMIQDIAKREGGEDKLKGKKIALLYHDSPFGKEPIALLKKRSEINGFDLDLYPINAPGIRQKSTWLQVKENKPDYVLLQIAGVMTPIAIKEAIDIDFPRDNIYGIWWASSENDVQELGDAAKGYRGITIHNSLEQGKVHEDLKKHVYDAEKGASPDAKSVGTLAHTRGMMISMLQVEAIRTAQEKFGVGQHMTTEQVRWGFENLNLSQERLDEIGFGKLMRPIKTSCENHMGTDWARIIEWNGKNFELASDWYQSNHDIVDPIVKDFGTRYAAEKKLEIRDCS